MAYKRFLIGAGDEFTSAFETDPANVVHQQAYSYSMDNDNEQYSASPFGQPQQGGKLYMGYPIVSRTENCTIVITFRHGAAGWHGVSATHLLSGSTPSSHPLSTNTHTHTYSNTFFGSAKWQNEIFTPTIYKHI